TPCSTLFPYTTLFRSEARAAPDFSVLVHPDGGVDLGFDRQRRPTPRFASGAGRKWPGVWAGTDSVDTQLLHDSSIRHLTICLGRSEEHTSELQSPCNL